MNLDLHRNSTLKPLNDLQVSEQDDCGVVEEDEIKSIHSSYSTQSI